MRDFEYEAPRSLADAVGLLSRLNGRARPLAGGTDLIDHVRTGRLTPDVLVDVKKIAELNRLEFRLRACAWGPPSPATAFTATLGLRPSTRRWRRAAGSSAESKFRIEPVSAAICATRDRPATRSRR